ncbi:MAG: aspartate/tyrosine/aromatic aminotransferase [Betaproteobacteria bacterium]|nr:aspartate/tyrosine/aromatic aminotransferase [Betaproteobacteria bacterium]
MTSTLFAQVERAPRDPILGLTESFNADTRADKVNLGVGVYYDDNGKLPLLKCIKDAEAKRVASAPARGYQPIEGAAAYNQSVQTLLFGASSQILAEQKVITIEALGGTGALKVGADYLRRLIPKAKVAISDPSWENHRALFEMAGFEVVNYRYYDSSSRGLDFEGMIKSIEALPAGTILVLHACCHNPTGVDLSDAQWAQVIATIQSKGHVPFLDMAYQGFGDGIDADASALRAFVASGLSFLVSSSFSKSFSLYGERVGALSIVTQSADEASRVLSQVKRTIRTNYSNPPTHGGAVVAMVLSTPELRATWEAELAQMRDRIKAMRQGLVDGLKAEGLKADFGFVTSQRGMFSYTGLIEKQVDRLRDEFGVYAVGTGRICIAALNSGNLGRVCKAIAAVAA